MLLGTFFTQIFAYLKKKQYLCALNGRLYIIQNYKNILNHEIIEKH